MTFASGTKIGPYELVEKIGSGGMGEVYRARDARLNRDVAIKFVFDQYVVEAFGSGTPSPSQASGKSGTPGTISHRRFLREAQASSALSHPNICTIYDIGEEAGRPYLVMELLRGETLKEALRHGPLSVTETVAFSRQIAAALAAAHAQGVVHRDIKPANLFVVGSEGRRQIKVLDFGLAKQKDSADLADSGDATAMFGGETSAGATFAGAGLDLTSPGSTLGTVAYMSPEQAEGQPLDARTDLFSLGSVMYEMATGKTPFAGGSTAAIFASLLTREPAPVSQVRAAEGLPALPPAFDSVVQKLLQKDKTQRYQTATAVERDMEDMSSGSSASGPVATGPLATSASGIHLSASAMGPKRSAGPWIAVAAVVLLLLAGGAWWKFHAASPAGGTAAAPAATTSEAAKDSIIVADFVNKTGDPVFDTTLNQALDVQLGQSPVLTLVSQRHLRQSLQYLGKKSDEPVTPAIAREIGEREGVKAILTGTIAKLGDQYLITLTATNTATGDDIATSQATAPNKDHVLDALNQASSDMRGKLGESLASIKKLNAPFGQATTPSLEAFRAYALGDAAHQRGDDIPEAEGHYKRALELDPNLAMAWARLGVIYINSGQTDKAIQYFTKAHSLEENVSEREKLYIDGHYNTEVTGDTDKGIETLEEATQLYPLVLDNFINLGVAYRHAGEVDKAFDVIQKALELSPDDAVALINVIGEYAFRDDYAGMKKAVAQAEKAGLNGTSLLASELLAYEEEGDTQAAQAILDRTAGRPDHFIVLRFRSTFQAESGQFRAARATMEQATQEAADARATEAEADGILAAPSLTALVEPCQDMTVPVKKALSLDKEKEMQVRVASSLAVCGDQRALPMLADLQKKYPQGTRIQNEDVPEGRAILAFKDGKPQQALDYLERARAYDLVSPGPYLRGLAYLQLHDAPRAIESLKIATRYKGMFGFTGVPPALAQLALGRAYVMAGDKADAKKAYETFFADWKNADPDLPQIAEAKKEYATL
jgi:serine/threonine protein kinase/tetratricopeptide (TPR) repeat protein